MMGPSAIRTLDTSNCETEPIRFPAAVQPHGALLVLHSRSGIIEAASENCPTFLGAAAVTLLGQPASQILGNAAHDAMLGDLYDGRQPLAPVSLGGTNLAARPSINETGQVLVDIEVETGDFPSMRNPYHRRQVLAGLRLLAEIPAIAQRSAELIRGMTGYDRVMLYRFDDAWNGEVIGEARIDGIVPYLGLNFPATDIPTQSRELLTTRAVRLIPDVLYVPSALISQDDRPIDLGPSCLRSVSPMHVEYLRNMKVRATLVGSLIVEGRLWGLVSCQQMNEPKYFGSSLRDALGWMFEDIALLIESKLIWLRRTREQGLGARRRHLVDAVRKADLKALIHPVHGADLLGVVAADGFALIAKDSISTTGRTPSEERIRSLQSRRRAYERMPTLFASNALGRDLQLEDAGDSVAGAVFVSLAYDPQVTLIWFRTERNFSVRWGGDPERMRIADSAGSLSPRKSFAQFTQAIKGQSLAWTSAELDSAAELGSLIEIEALRDREAFAQTILNSSPLQTAVLDTQGVIVSVNEAWTRLAAERSSPGTPLYAIGLDYQSAADALAGKPRGEDRERAWIGIKSVIDNTCAHFTFDYSSMVLDQHRWFRLTVYPMLAPVEGAVLVHQDITDRKLIDLELEHYRHRLETLVDERTAELEKANAAAAAAHRASIERLNADRESKIQSSKLEAMGTLAAGIAHDFNNILAGIVAYAELADDELIDGSEAKESVARVISGCFRARDLVARMLDFARERPGDLLPVNVVVQVREALALLRASLQPSIELAFQSSITDATISILADRTQIMQIVMNLCINSAHAMDNRGVIDVSIDHAMTTEDAPQGLRDGICITVVDTGRGMTPEVMERIFDPFYTTKAPGEGSGLGLSVVYGIVKSLGGAIKVRSSTAVGSTGTQLQVFLPAVESGSLRGLT
jgi:light-regulated signal transduction histidine kinase (bacteriophytochrome)